MKFTRPKILIILLVLGLIVVYASLLSSYVKQQGEQNSIRGQIDTSLKTLRLLPAAPADLPKQLEEARKVYNTALTDVSGSDIDSTHIIEELIKTADIFSLDVNPVITDQWMERTYGSSVYRILPVTLEIKGGYQAIMIFIQQLEDRTRFPYLSIEGLNMAPASPAAQASGDSEQQATLKVDIIVRLSPES